MNNQRKQKRRPGNGSSGGRVNPAMGGLSHCATKYQAALADPFDGPEDACIPDFPPLLTGKYKVWTRGTFATSTNAAALGTGYIVYDPACAIVNDVACLWRNNLGGAVAGAIDIVGAGTFITATSNSPFTAAQLGLTGVQYRVVAAGLRIKYNGSELVRGGDVIGLQHPIHTSLQAFSQTQLLQYTKECRILPVTRDEWTTLRYRPVDTDDSDYKVATPTPAVGANDSSYMGFMVRAPDTTGVTVQSFTFEACTLFEVLGDIVTNKTPSHVDIAGYGAVAAVTNVAPAFHQPSQVSGSALQPAAVTAASNYLAHNTSNPAAKPLQLTSTHASALSGVAGFVDDVISVGEKVIPYVASAAEALFTLFGV